MTLGIAAPMGYNNSVKTDWIANSEPSGRSFDPLVNPKADRNPLSGAKHGDQFAAAIATIGMALSLG